MPSSVASHTPEWPDSSTESNTISLPSAESDRSASDPGKSRDFDRSPICGPQLAYYKRGSLRRAPDKIEHLALVRRHEWSIGIAFNRYGAFAVLVVIPDGALSRPTAAINDLPSGSTAMVPRS